MRMRASGFLVGVTANPLRKDRGARSSRVGSLKGRAVVVSDTGVMEIGTKASPEFTIGAVGLVGVDRNSVMPSLRNLVGRNLGEVTSVFRKRPAGKKQLRRDVKGGSSNVGLVASAAARKKSRKG